MTDGQSFYLVLSVFYLIECIKFAPPGSVALISRGGGFGTCSPRQALMTAWGMKKDVFLAPLPPWPGAIYIASAVTEKRDRFYPISTVSGIRRHQKLIAKATKTLRYLAILNFLNFFLLLPLVYIQTYSEAAVLGALAYAYLALLGTAIHYRALHKRLLPSFEADRLKTTLYTALLPWHAPRCLDELTLKSSLRWDPLAALACNASNKETLAQLKQLWRNAHYLEHPLYPADALSSALRQADLEHASWLDAPGEIESELYCPCCLSGFEQPATHCSDCKGVSLLKS